MRVQITKYWSGCQIWRNHSIVMALAFVVEDFHEMYMFVFNANDPLPADCYVRFRYLAVVIYYPDDWQSIRKAWIKMSSAFPKETCCNSVIADVAFFLVLGETVGQWKMLMHTWKCPVVVMTSPELVRLLTKLCSKAFKVLAVLSKHDTCRMTFGECTNLMAGISLYSSITFSVTCRSSLGPIRPFPPNIDSKVFSVSASRKISSEEVL